MKKVVIMLCSIIILLFYIIIELASKNAQLFKKYSETNGNRIWDIYSLTINNSKNFKLNNLILTISKDYKSQKRSGGTVYFLDNTYLNNVKSIYKEICYKYDESCDFAGSTGSSPTKNLKNHKEGMGILNTKIVSNSLITDENGKVYEYEEDFYDKLFSMYLKVTITYGDDSTKIIKEDITVTRKAGKDHSNNYKLKRRD